MSYFFIGYFLAGWIFTVLTGCFSKDEWSTPFAKLAMPFVVVCSIIGWWIFIISDLLFRYFTTSRKK